MTGHQLRTKYLDFFASKNSLVIPSSSLIPTDPTTLLTSAGMQPLVPYFKGEETPPSPRLASCQKCCRTDDFEQVGVTWRHASFFEMLGNFSFGDYFKRDAIVWGWEFLTKTLNIPPDRLWVSVYEDDDEAPEIWKRDVGLSAERIYRFGKKDNWWGPVGKSGPCGPDSEIFYDRGARYDSGDPELDRPGGDGDRYGELWNLVFQQYNQQENGELVPLPAPGIDTGMGLERTAAVLQNVDTIHQTDLFAPIVNAIDFYRAGAAPEYSLTTPTLDPNNPRTRPLKVVADHLRAAVFMAGDGIVPGNNGRDYMLRRLIRRAYLTGRELDFSRPFLSELVPVVARVYRDVYPELTARESTIATLLQREEERFAATIESGIGRLEDLISDASTRGAKTLPGAEVFRLYETFGFPRELTSEMLETRGLDFDENEYAAAAERHSKISGVSVGEYEARSFGDLQTEFVGYEKSVAASEIVSARRVEPFPFPFSVTVNERWSGGDNLYQIVLDKTPFYAESGGQIGDIGTLSGAGFRARVLDTQKQGKAFVHTVEIEEGEAHEGMKVRAEVNGERRRAIERAHSATHLLHAALRRHLGAHVEQRGSLVEPDRLRFDFVHFGPISSEELAAIEDTMNAEILRSQPVEIRVTSLDEARKAGAMALFGEKYGDAVRTVRMGDFSLELCGGTHLPTTSAAGICRIVSESGVGANLRRIEALTGKLALQHDRAQSEQLRETARVLASRPEAAAAAAEKLRAKLRDTEKQLHSAQQKMAGGALDELMKNVTPVNGLQMAASRAPQNTGADALRDLADRLNDKLNGVVVLVSENDGKVAWAVKVSKDAVARGVNAGNLVRELAKITGGGGGGRPDFAQAGGKDATKIDEALARAGELLAAQVGA